jgi:hypothetical protein
MMAVRKKRFCPFFSLDFTRQTTFSARSSCSSIFLLFVGAVLFTPYFALFAACFNTPGIPGAARFWLFTSFCGAVCLVARMPRGGALDKVRSLLCR